MTMPFDKIGTAVAMLDAPTDQEKLAAVGAVERLLTGAGMGFVDLGDAIGRLQPPRAVSGMRPPSSSARSAGSTRTHASVADRDKAFWLGNYAANLLTDREFEFCAAMLGRLPRSWYRPTETQAAWLDALYDPQLREVA